MSEIALISSTMSAVRCTSDDSIAAMQSEIKVGQHFNFKLLSDNPPQEREAVVTRVLSNRE